MHVAITGASSGIGEALAREFAKAGAKLTIVARRKDRLEALAKELGGGVFVVTHDLSIPEKAAEWIASAEAAHGPIDVLINNAGIAAIGQTVTFDVEFGEKAIRTNLMSPLRLTRAVLPGMMARKRGTIVDVASVAALAAPPGFTWYGASKGGLATASEALRGELKGTGVHVVTVYPGPIATAMGEEGFAALEDTPSVRKVPVGTATQLAKLVRTAVEKKQARIIYPAAYGLARNFPGFARWVTDLMSPKVKPNPPAA